MALLLYERLLKGLLLKGHTVVSSCPGQDDCHLKNS